MRPDTILINAQPGETRLALLAGERVIEVTHFRHGDGGVEGAVFAGRVTKINRDLNAAFVDIGGDAPGFLAASDVRRCADERIKSVAAVLGEGDRVLVQADREAMDGKGPRLTCRLTLPGRCLNLLTGGGGVKIPKFVPKGDKARLEGLSELLPDGMGVSFNPASGGADMAALKNKLVHLVGELDGLYDAFEEAKKVPCLLRPAPSALDRALALSSPNCRIVTDDPDAAVGMASEPWRGPEPLFDALGIEDVIDAALAPAVALPSGGRVLIAETPALTAIDVDTARAAEGQPRRLAAKANDEAVGAIARELRLRNISGQIVIDFLAMKGRKEQNDLLARLRNALAADPVECHVLGMTGLGLVELTRRRRGPSLASYLGSTGPWRPSPETAGLAALRRAAALRGGRIVLIAAADVAAALQGPLKGAVADVQARLGGALTVKTDERLHPGEADVRKG
ncbi:MAG: ribonuclease E/G [Rhodospirillaceae bacterium]